mgnify:CR=1 FL=1
MYTGQGEVRLRWAAFGLACGWTIGRGSPGVGLRLGVVLGVGAQVAREVDDATLLVDLGDLESTVKRAQSTAHLVDSPDVLRGLGSQTVGQVFDVLRSRQRVHRTGNARLVGEYLLGPEG